MNLDQITDLTKLNLDDVAIVPLESEEMPLFGLLYCWD